MIKEVGQVVKVDGDLIWVETKVTSTCNACAAKSNCGTSSIAKAFGDKSVVNQVVNDKGAELGDKVEVGIPEESLITGAFLVYLLPLVSAVIFALVSQFWLSQFIDISEPILIVLTFFGGFIGFLIAKHKIRKADDEEYRVRLLQVLPDEIEIKQV